MNTFMNDAPNTFKNNEIGIPSSQNPSLKEARSFCEGLFEKRTEEAAFQLKDPASKAEAKFNSESSKENGYIRMLEQEMKSAEPTRDADGFAVFKDDLGNAYQKGESLALDGDFKINDGIYKTDSSGRPCSQEKLITEIGNPSINRDNVAQKHVGSLGEPGDHGSHGIMHNGGGEPGRINLTPVRGEINTGPYKTVENAISKQVKDFGRPTLAHAVQEYANDITYRPNIVRLEGKNEHFDIYGAFDNVKGSDSLVGELRDIVGPEQTELVTGWMDMINDSGSASTLLGYIKEGNMVTAYVKDEAITGNSGVKLFNMPSGGF